MHLIKRREKFDGQIRMSAAHPLREVRRQSSIAASAQDLEDPPSAYKHKPKEITYYYEKKKLLA